MTLLLTRSRPTPNASQTLISPVAAAITSVTGNIMAILPLFPRVDAAYR
jgi:hypothetical protein